MVEKKVDLENWKGWGKKNEWTDSIVLTLHRHPDEFMGGRGRGGREELRRACATEIWGFPQGNKTGSYWSQIPFLVENHIIIEDEFLNLNYEHPYVRALLEQTDVPQTGPFALVPQTDIDTITQPEILRPEIDMAVQPEIDTVELPDSPEIDFVRRFDVFIDILIHKEKFILPLEELINTCISMKVAREDRLILNRVGGISVGKTTGITKISKTLHGGSIDQHDFVEVKDNFDNIMYFIGGTGWGGKWISAVPIKQIMKSSCDSKRLYDATIDECTRSDMEKYVPLSIFGQTTENLINIPGLGKFGEFEDKVPCTSNFICWSTENSKRFGSYVDQKLKVIDRMITIECYLKPEDREKLDKERKNTSKLLEIDNILKNNPDILNPILKFILEDINDQDLSNWKDNNDDINDIMKKVHNLLMKFKMDLFTDRDRGAIIKAAYSADKLKISSFTKRTAMAYMIKQRLFPKFKCHVQDKPGQKTIDSVKAMLNELKILVTNERLDEIVNNKIDYMLRNIDDHGAPDYYY